MSRQVRTRRPIRGGVGESVSRPDGVAKVRGEFAFSSDLRAPRMLWGVTVRSPWPHARIEHVDVGPALAVGGVRSALVAADVPLPGIFGIEHADQPVLARHEVRFSGEPVALVAAEDLETARRGADAVVVRYRELPHVTDPGEAERAGEVFRSIRIRAGDQAMRGDVVVEGEYRVGVQDQAPLGTESGLSVPDGEGGVDLFVSTQDVHTDHRQVVAALGLRPEQVRVHPAGVGGAFGAREDVSLQIHLCLLAIVTGRPVKMVYGREESFLGHVHRHSARMWYRHEADRSGLLVRVEARILLDGGAYASTSSPVVANASYFAVGPYRCPSVAVDGMVARTNNPPSGAMRGFGAVQACFAHESQMDLLAGELGIDPVEIRLRNALGPGDHLPTSGQQVDAPLPVAEALRTVAALPLPGPPAPGPLPGLGVAAFESGSVRRGVGYAVGVKNLAFSEGVDDFADARVAITSEGAVVETAAAEVGQGITTVCQQIARTTLGMEHVEVRFVDTGRIGPAHSSSASRQTQMTGGAVREAARRARASALGRVGGDDLDDEGVWQGGRLVATLETLCRDGPVVAEARFHHPPTEEPDADGQGRVHAGYCMSAHRAVVDVDSELGLLRVVQVDTAQDVGRAINPAAVVGQIQGGILQGVGLAVMEELVVTDGRVVNPSFTDYLLPTILDAPHVEAVLLE
ncbi:MAG TPA: molybdopterin cofactor-binding domain-containing protein, partial [Actinomycetota bacterium]|nr:molybdopterin cofactor-binding domain-containing protein [Actinomycetota bacterium]